MSVDMRTFIEQVTGSSIPKVRYTDVSTTTTDDDEVIVVTEAATITLHTPSTTEPLPPKRIKRWSALGTVHVTEVDNGGYYLNLNYQAVDVQWTGSEWISL